MFLLGSPGQRAVKCLFFVVHLLSLRVESHCYIELIEIINCKFSLSRVSNHHTTTILRPFFRDHPGEPVPEENFWTLWYKGRLTEADILTIQLGATPSGLTSAYLHHPPIFFTGRMPFLPPNQQHQSTEG